MATYQSVISHIKAAQVEAEKLGVKNVLQPGIIKEMILAETLGHVVIPAKAQPDAKDAAGNFYEYLCSLETSNNFQIDRVTNDNLYRITRNKMFYFGFFRDPTSLVEVIEVDPNVVLTEVKRQLAASKNDISHLNLSGEWVRKSGKRVHP